MTLVYSFHVGVKHSNSQFQQVLKVDGSELERAVSSVITRKRGGGGGAGRGALQVQFDPGNTDGHPEGTAGILRIIVISIFSGSHK